MASSSLIDSVNSALDNLDSLVADCPSYLSFGHETLRKQRFGLRSLRTFVLLEIKFLNDVHLMYHDNKDANGNLGSLLRRIEDVVSRYSQKISLCSQGYNPQSIASESEGDFQSLKEDIDKWYIATSDNTRQLNSLTAKEVVEITEYISENLLDFPGFSRVLAGAMEVLGGHVNFLKNCCRFATSRGVDHGQMKDFLTHTEAVAISAAHICLLCRGIEGTGRREGIHFKISMMLQKIKPIDPQVCKTYTQVISCSKLSTRLDTPDPTQDMDDDSTIVIRISLILSYLFFGRCYNWILVMWFL